MSKLLLSMLAGLIAGSVAVAADRDILVADFEGDDYGTWKATGEAFGLGPARGTLPQQMVVSGFLGRGLVNSYFHGDGTTGTLTSPPFKLERRYLNFLIGGGMHPGKACMQLLVGGQVVRSATGPNDRPGGSEQLDWEAWDVGEWRGQEAVLQIVDQATGGWGHINIDHILLSDEPRGSAPAVRELTVERRYLHLPVRGGARKCRMGFLVDDRRELEFDIELAEAEPEFWMFFDASPWQNRRLKIDVDRLPFGSQGLAAIRQSDDLPQKESLYREPYRPQFHFTTRRGWHNDPNGLVFYGGEYHLFYQHNPYGTAWGNMTWGHAVSTDLVRWNELPDAIHPDSLGTIFSGSAVVDGENTAGWKTGQEEVLVCIYTSAGNEARPPVPFTQSVAYSNDRGRTWTKYSGNPVLGHIAGSNRDPKVFWYAPTRRWIMALFLDGEEYALFSSPNLREWERLCTIPPIGGSECPDMFELPVRGADAGQRRWVFWSANGNYLVGTFDGRKFVSESGPHPSKFGANDYAAQTYSGIPDADGRRIQISWMAGGKYPGMPFNQQMTVPRELTLRTTPDGIRLFIEPVREIATLRAKEHAWTDVEVGDVAVALLGLKGDLFDIELTLDPGQAKKVGLEIRGQRIEYSVPERHLTALGNKAPLSLEDGRLELRILVDRTSVELFANRGRVSMATCYLADAKEADVRLHAEGGAARAPSVRVWEMQSIWP